MDWSLVPGQGQTTICFTKHVRPEKKDSGLPWEDGKISLDDIYAFKLDSEASYCDKWRIRRITQFSDYKEKFLKDRQYKEDFTEIKSTVWVLCSWYHSTSTNFHMSQRPILDMLVWSLHIFVHYFTVVLLK